MRKQMWIKIKRVMAGVMMAALLVTTAQGTFGAEDNSEISVLGEELQMRIVCR